MSINPLVNRSLKDNDIQNLLNAPDIVLDKFMDFSNSYDQSYRLRESLQKHYNDDPLLYLVIDKLLKLEIHMHEALNVFVPAGYDISNALDYWKYCNDKDAKSGEKYNVL